MQTTNLTTLQIHKLSEAQYNRELANGTLDENSLYLTPDEEIDLSGYATLEQAESYASTAAATVKNELLNGAGEAYDTLKELGDLIDDNQDAITALEKVATGKADVGHIHAISDVTDLQTQLDGMANTDHDHTISDVTDLQTQLDNKADSTHIHDDATTTSSGFMTATMVTKLNGIAEGATNVTVDSALSNASTNPVQNKVLTAAINEATSAITANTSSISSHTTAITDLQDKVGDGFEECTSDDIRAMFV